MVLLHRWPALVLGLVLVIETTSGAVLLYHGDIFRATNSDLYAHTDAGSPGATPVRPDAAIDLVRAAHPGFDATWVATDDGVLVVGDATYKTLWFVDPGTGRINGSGNLDTGVMGWLVNLHDCAFSCEGYPWYSSWLAAPVWVDGPSFLTGITWANVLIGTLGVLMILLVLSSLRLWWPGVKRLRSRFVVRTDKGRFARDFDLHNVIGAVALPFILMWAVTGASFEFPGVEKAWLALTGGDSSLPEQAFSLTPHAVPAGTPRIDYDTAVSVALRQVPGEAAWVGRPTKAAPYWEVDIDSHYGSSSHRAIYHSDSYVLVDPHDATHFSVLESSQGDPAANRFFDKYFEPAHFGWQVNGWWRLIWLAFGLAPLALMVTGVSTWLFRRSVRARRREAARQREAVRASAVPGAAAS